MLNESALSEAARRRFTAEANVTAGLAHRHIVQVFDAKVTTDGRPYIVMPYYPQPNLSVRARRAHFSVAEVLRIGIQIGSAVETSHRRGVLHRDIKPQNILTDSYGEPALTDFGIATTKGGDGPEGLSVPWSPPEILYGTGPGDQRSDVYSLGATLWHLLAGRSPFEQPGGDNKPLALMGRIKSDPVPRTRPRRRARQPGAAAAAGHGQGPGCPAADGDGADPRAAVGRAGAAAAAHPAHPARRRVARGHPRRRHGRRLPAGAQAMTGWGHEPGPRRQAQEAHGSTRAPWETTGHAGHRTQGGRVQAGAPGGITQAGRLRPVVPWLVVPRQPHPGWQ